MTETPTRAQRRRTPDIPDPLPIAGRPRQQAVWHGVPVQRIYAAIRSGDLPVYQPPGAHRLVRTDDMRAWLERYLVAPPTAAEAEHVQEVLERRRRLRRVPREERVFERVRSELEAGAE
jgi:excisionase family DNA binding protein